MVLPCISVQLLPTMRCDLVNHWLEADEAVHRTASSTISRSCFILSEAKRRFFGLASTALSTTSRSWEALRAPQTPAIQTANVAICPTYCPTFFPSFLHLIASFSESSKKISKQKEQKWNQNERSRKDKQAERPRKQNDTKARNMTMNPEEERVIGTS